MIPAANMLPVDSRSIPQWLRDQKRWAPWRARWNATREKFDKIPVRADRPEYGISTASPEKWFDFDAAERAYKEADGMLAGVGFVMTGFTELIGIDLDNVIDDSGVAPWAQEVIDRIGSYTEVSPSGKGLRIFTKGDLDSDWVNTLVGIEVYNGHAPRYLTVTGRHVLTTPREVRVASAESLAGLAASYRRTVPSERRIEDIDAPVPLAPAELPSLDEGALPPRAREFLAGEPVEDRSRALFSTAVALYRAGLTDIEVFSTLANNDAAMAVAQDHRPRSDDATADAAALMYLWQHHTLKARARAGSRLSDADFESLVAEGLASNQEAAVPDDQMFSDLGADEPQKKPGERFQWVQAAEYAARERRVSWIIPNVLPRAELVGIYGESGSGKTFVALGLLLAACLGGPDMPYDWMGHEVKHRHRVAYVAAEGAIGVQDRLKAYAHQHNVDLSKLDLHILADSPDITDKTVAKKLLLSLLPLKPDLIVFDTLAQVTPGANENSSEDMGTALHHAKMLHRATGATICLIGHSGKDATRGQRGWSGLKGAMDAQLEVTKLATHRVVSVVKLKDGAGEGTQYPFKLDEVLLAIDEDGHPVTSCVVRPIPREEAERAEAGAKPSKAATKREEVVELCRELCGPANRPFLPADFRKHVEAVLSSRYKDSDMRSLRHYWGRTLDDILKSDAFIPNAERGTYTAADPVPSLSTHD